MKHTVWASPHFGDLQLLETQSVSSAIWESELMEPWGPKSIRISETGRVRRVPRPLLSDKTVKKDAVETNENRMQGSIFARGTFNNRYI